MKKITKKSSKAIMTGVLASALSIQLLAVPTVFAADYNVLVNGKALAMDVAPVNIGDRVLVPFRAIVEALAGSVSWDEATRTVTASRGDKNVSLQIDNTTAKINDVDTTLDVPAQIVSGRTMVPVRFVSESLDAKVEWDGETNTVSVTAGYDFPVSTEGAMIYPFNQSAGATTAIEVTGNSADAFLFGGPTFIGGHEGRGINLNGNQQFLNLPAGILENMSDFTICTWVKPNKTDTWIRIFDFGTGTDKYMFLTVNAGENTPRFAITNGGNAEDIEQRLNSSKSLVTNEWQHIAVTLSGKTATMYINGEEVGKNENMTLRPMDLGNTNQNYIGKSQWNDPYYNGVLDEFCIFNRALSADDIRAIYNK